jgi:DNA-binding LytR/AlgR family response regulator
VAVSDHFFVRADKVVHRILVSDLLFCKAEGDFVRLVLKDRMLPVSETLQHFETELRAMGVIRTHRSFLLRLAALEKLEGNRVFTARGEVPIGRKYRERLLGRLR